MSRGRRLKDTTRSQRQPARASRAARSGTAPRHLRTALRPTSLPRRPASPAATHHPPSLPPPARPTGHSYGAERSESAPAVAGELGTCSHRAVPPATRPAPCHNERPARSISQCVVTSRALPLQGHRARVRAVQCVQSALASSAHFTCSVTKCATRALPALPANNDNKRAPCSEAGCREFHQ